MRNSIFEDITLEVIIEGCDFKGKDFIILKVGEKDVYILIYVFVVVGKYRGRYGDIVIMCIFLKGLKDCYIF